MKVNLEIKPYPVLPHSEPELAACPFCGCGAYLMTGHGGCQFGKCKGCGAEGARAWRRGWSCEEEFEVVKEERKRDAAEKWNRRANALFILQFQNESWQPLDDAAEPWILVAKFIVFLLLLVWAARRVA